MIAGEISCGSTGSIAMDSCKHLSSSRKLCCSCPYNVAVRISLSHAAEVCRGQMTQIGILLPIPESLKAALEAARSGKSGILLQQANREFASARTSITFATKSYGK